MDAKFFLGIGLAVVLVFAGAGIYTSLAKLPGSGRTASDRELLYQVSTIDALMTGVYDGVQPVGEIRKHGDFGTGTFNALDGEMIVLDGIVYQAKADGRIYTAADNQTVPFATVTWFDRDFAVTTSTTMNYSVFSSVMEAGLPSRNMVYAVRMHGTFPRVTVRAVPAQEKPYPTLTTATENQSVFTYANATGTVAGFYFPVFFQGINMPGYHLHFISDDHTTGGHILDFTVPEGTTAEYDITPEFEMVLPTSGAFTGADLTQNRTADLAKAER